MTRLLAVCLAFCSFILIGCSSGSSGGSAAPYGAISVSVSPTAATIDANNPINISATVANNPNNDGVTWTVSGNNTQGTLSNATKTSVTYTAPTPPSGLLTVYVTATSVADITRTAVTTISIPAGLSTGFSDIGITLGTPYSAQLKGSGGIPPYNNFTVTSGSLPPCLTLSSSGMLTSINGAAPNASCIGAYSAFIQFTDSGTPTPLTSQPGQLFISVARPTINFTNNVPSTATLGLAYTGGTITATGAVGSVTYTLSSGTIPPGLTVDASTGAVTGTPTATGDFLFFINATDADGDTAVDGIQITVNPVNLNAALKGTYACVATGQFIRNGNTTPWGAAFSIVADGQGNITAGAEDLSNATTDTVNTLTGTYSLPDSGSGTAAIVETTTTGSPIDHNTRNWALFAQPSTSPITHFLMLDTDVPQPNYNGANGSARCYLTDPSAFTAATLNHSFVFALHGVNAPSTQETTAEAQAGRFDAPTGTIANGYLEDAIGGGSSPELVTFTGSFSTLDPTSGRVVATFTRSDHNVTSTQQLALYFIDATRALAVDISPWNGEGGMILTGELRLQKQSSWSAASVSGPFVFSSQGSDLTGSSGSFPVTGAYSQILHGSADGSGILTLDRSFRNDSGTYTNGNNTTNVTLGFDTTNLGRATLLVGSTPISLYFFDNNQAFELAQSPTTVEFGRLEAQTQTTFSNSAIAGSYLAGQILALPPQNDIADVFTIDASGFGSDLLSIVTTAPGFVSQSFDIQLTPDTVAPAAGTFNLWDAHSNQSSCAVVTSTEFVCLPQTNSAPYIFVGQQ